MSPLLTRLIALPLLAASLSASPAPDQAATLSDLLDVDERLRTLRAAVDAAGWRSALDGEGPFTVFAPTDEAFAALPEGVLDELLAPANRPRLEALLRGHVVPGEASLASALAAGRAGTLEGDELPVSLEGGQVRVGRAAVLDNDLRAGNGLVHVIDQVLLPPARPGPEDLIGLAIQRGAPLFNAGQPAACAAVYEVAALGLLALDPTTLPEASRDAVGQALAAPAADPRARAWALRDAFDVTLLELSREVAPTAAEASDGRRVLVDFGPDEPAWLTINDDVMGGISRGSLRGGEEGTGVFAGQLSLENNGGFSSVRTRARDLDLGDWDGLVLRVRGDGRRYRVAALEDDSRRNVHVWQAGFETVADEWIEVTVPFDEMTHQVMGWSLPDPVDPASIRSLGLSIADKDTRPFALEVDWIAAWRR